MGYDPNWKRMNSQMPKNVKKCSKYQFSAMNPKSDKSEQYHTKMAFTEEEDLSHLEKHCHPLKGV